MRKVEHEVASDIGTWISPVFCRNLMSNWQHLNTTVVNKQLVVCFIYIPLREAVALPPLHCWDMGLQHQ